MTASLKTLFTALLLLTVAALAQAGSPKHSAASSPSASVGDFSGTYTFLREDEDLQINVRDGKLDGYLTRYGETEGDKSVQLQHLIEKSSLTGDEISFTTTKIHGVWFEFKGRVRRGEGKTAGNEGYYVLEGTVTRYETGADKKTTAKSREVQFRSLPSDFGLTMSGQKSQKKK
ncbi:MAG TPA: hypothetical protein VGQ94_01840 [Terriglobales bacterium]|nr:hypothetical protein [Terriglobales bacterium]